MGAKIYITGSTGSRFAWQCAKQVDSGLNQRIVSAFWAKVRKADGACWLWAGATYRWGYGQFSYPGWAGTKYAHRLSWQVAHGRPVPAGFSVLHQCDTPGCVNPEHFFLGTQADNMKDAARKGRLHAPRPSARKFSDQQVAAMRAMRAAGAIYAEIAAAFDTSKAMAYKWARGPRGSAQRAIA